MSESHYELLGVESDASKDEIRSAYRERLEDLRGKVETGRSDQVRNGARAETARLNAAWQVLSEGAEVHEELSPSPWGTRFGTLTDRWGVSWMFDVAAPATP